MALIRIQNLQLVFGDPPLFDGLDLSIYKGERIALIGRNGCGKSTLMKVINDEIQYDDGEVVREQGIHITRLEQDVIADMQGSIYDVVATGLGDIGKIISEYHAVIAQEHSDEMMKRMEKLHSALDAVDGWGYEQKIQTTLSKLGLSADTDASTLSGGLKRRVLLARALVKSPDLLLLDEPTNHLDIESIEWLEGFLKNAGITLLFITHDRVFLQNIATRIIEIDRGKINEWPGNLHQFLQAKETALEVEEKSNALFDKRLKEEEKWVRQGIKARRTRNEGRVRALEKMREERKRRRQVEGKVDVKLSAAEKSGKVVIETNNISYSYSDTPIIKNFSTSIMRGDKIGVIGANGVGKTTLLKLLLGKLKPDTGEIKIGTNLEIAYFDQLRATLDSSKTALENVAEGSDTITIDGKSKHIISYLQDFLFTPERARSPITRLSGGEKNRLLLAKLFTKPFNLLVLDEPTNDLDVETLELLESLLVNYSGTLFLVSHDRDFLDNVVSSTMVFTGNAQVDEYVGGYSDWLRHKTNNIKQQVSIPEKKQTCSNKTRTGNKPGYKQQRELKEIPKQIEKLEQKQQQLQQLMAADDFYHKDQSEIQQAQDELQIVNNELNEIFLRWEELESV